MSFVIAEVEDVAGDPTQSGRAAVRILGHQDGLNLEQLRWAQTIGTAQNPAINKSGNAPIGTSVNGLQKGSKVLVWYMDGPDGQIPIIIGSLPSADDVNGNLTKGSSPYAAKGPQSGYKDNRLIPSKGDRTDPKQATLDSKPIHEYALNEAPNDTKEPSFQRVGDLRDGFTLGSGGNPGT